MFSVIVPEHAEPPTRRSHKKSRGGCKVCKERKLKCDEVKPVCGNCQRRFISPEACSYPHHSTPHASSTSSSRPRTRPLAPRTHHSTYPPTHPQSSSHPQSSESDTHYRSDTTFSLSDDENSEDWKLALPASLRGELLDPFSTLPESRVRGVNVLLKHYLRTAVYKTFPWQPPSDTNPTTNFFVPLVWKDTVLFHATLHFSALRLESGRAGRLGVDVRGLEGECIRLLRERVEGEGREQAVSDLTISAVATMASVEHEKGNMRMLKMHMDGLRRMVYIRGGLHAVREASPMTANWVFWMFVVSICEIQFPPLDPVLPPFFPAEHNLTASPPSVISHFDDMGPLHEEPPPVDLVSLGVEERIAAIINSLQHVSQLVPTHTSYPTANTSMIMLTRICTLLSHLLSLPPITPDSIPLNPVGNELSSLITAGGRFASLLHILTPWRGLPPDGTIAINHILHQLIGSLKLVTSSGSGADVNNVLVLWMFAVGGVSSLNMPERTWFVNHLVEMTGEMEIGCWETWKASVSRCIWHERLYVRAYRKLWDEVAAKRGDLVDE